MRTTDNQPIQKRRAVGLFSTRQEAERAMHRLRDTGFDMNSISVVAKSGEGLRDLTTDRDYDPNKSNAEQAKGGAGAGATAGAATGGAIGLIGSLGILAIPGVGPIAEVGFLLANTLLGGGIGAASGGLLGALIGWGVPEDRANYYNDRVYNNDDYLVLVEGTEQEIRAAESVLSDNGIRDWNIYGSTTAPTHATTH
ncbi:general stress protein [Nodosilinea sp. LEGE 07298]|uniref:general stress protein n=1 Tax=Nodosilinea sp. LEGE 07298 TaxID=2777970 RepID=UPI001881E681|nr:general stress protein [Nodosilinea sp. LEGE 07298]MBE9112717.1 general stress protein [Nodosilinea sp. LEGE 07298]